MRAFVSLELPEEVKKEIKTIQQELKKAGIQAKWVRPEIAHLTLVFLGSITPNMVEPISGILDETAREMSPAKLHLLKIGCFPNPAKPRIIFVDLGGELGKLHALTKKIRKGLKKEKIWFDKKPFIGHATLARIKKSQDLKNLVGKVKVKRVKFMADEVTFYQSQLTEAGPIYEKIKVIKINAN